MLIDSAADARTSPPGRASITRSTTRHSAPRRCNSRARRSPSARTGRGCCVSPPVTPTVGIRTARREEIRERNDRLDEACAEIGRDPDEIIRSLYGWTIPMGVDPWSSPDAFADVVGRYREAGMSEFLMEAPHEEQFPMMERIATEILPGLRTPAA